MNRQNRITSETITYEQAMDPNYPNIDDGTMTPSHVSADAHVSSELNADIADGQSTNTSTLGNTLRQGTMAVMTVLNTLTPSATTVGTAAGLGTLAVATQSCETAEIDPNAIDYNTDNPKHKEKFMSDVVFRTLGNGEAKLHFEAVWVPNTNGKGGNYKLKPLPIINFDQAKIALENDARRFNIPLEKMGFGFFLSNNNGFSMAFAIPYSVVSSLNGEQIMKFEDYPQYLVSNIVGKPDQFLSKNDIGFLRISSLSSLNVENEVIRPIQIISPYILGN